MADWAPNDPRWLEGKSVNALLKLLFEVRVIGGRHMPRTGPAILAVNHQSMIDPPLIGSSVGLETGRIAGFFGAAEYLKNPIVKMIFDHTEGIPVYRGSGQNGPVDAGIERLNEGRVVGIFPEGTRSLDGKLGKGKIGLGLMALISGAPVVPAAITGAYEAWPKSAKKPNLGGRIVLRLGNPIYPEQNPSPSKEEALAFSALVMDQIRQLAKKEGFDL